MRKQTLSQRMNAKSLISLCAQRTTRTLIRRVIRGASPNCALRGIKGVRASYELVFRLQQGGRLLEANAKR